MLSRASVFKEAKEFYQTSTYGKTKEKSSLPARVKKLNEHIHLLHAKQLKDKNRMDGAAQNREQIVTEKRQ